MKKLFLLLAILSGLSLGCQPTTAPTDGATGAGTSTDTTSHEHDGHEHDGHEHDGHEHSHDASHEHDAAK